VNYLYAALIAVWGAAIVWRIAFSGGGQALFIRKIPGLESLDEAVGRATEMGRPIFFALPASGGVGISSLSALAVLSRVARLAAKYSTRIIVTTMDYVVYTMAEEVCKEAYASQGQGALFDPPRDLLFINAQFPYAMGSAGLIHRERVAANFLFGDFQAESLLIAEAGSQVGAIQVAGTDSTLQIPFFIVSCDYTLIGEELYAASAYLSREPTMLGSLAGQDLVKVTLLGVLALGAAIATWAVHTAQPFNWFVEWLVAR